MNSYQPPPPAERSEMNKIGYGAALYEHYRFGLVGYGLIEYGLKWIVVLCFAIVWFG